MSFRLRGRRAWFCACVACALLGAALGALMLGAGVALAAPASGAAVAGAIADPERTHAPSAMTLTAPDRNRTETATATQAATQTASAPASPAKDPRLSDQLGRIRGRVMSLQEELLSGLKTQKQARSNIKRIQELIELQRQERELSRERMTELERTVKELEFRRELLTDRIRTQQREIRRFLTMLEKSLRESWVNSRPSSEAIEAPRRKTLANLADRGLREIETYKADLSDADQLEQRIAEEKQQLSNMIQDLQEQEGILEFNRQLQSDLLRKKYEERVAQLENYRKLKGAEAQVERLIGDFNARLELERATESERAAAKAMTRGLFAQLKGKLPLPLQGGRVVSSFGRAFDPASRLYVFKKGIEILPEGASSGDRKKHPIRAVSAGKVAYSGTLPDYGNVTIIDHGEHFYSLVANLGDVERKAGDAVAAGDTIGQTDDRGTPVYFEIRSRNVPVNPLQWLSN